MFWALAQIAKDLEKRRADERERQRRAGWEDGYKQGVEEGLRRGLELGMEKGRGEFIRELVERNVALPPEILDEVNRDGGYLPRSWLF